MGSSEGGILGQLFRDTVSRLEGAGLHFWLESGALLGMVRDGALIPWDHDIDLGIWRDEIDEEAMARLFDGGPFTVRKPPESDCIQICPLEWKTQTFIDLNLYTRRADQAVTTICFFRQGWWQRLGVLLSDSLAGREHYPHKNPVVNLIQRGLYSFLSRGVASILAGAWLRRLEQWAAGLQKKKTYAVYEYPARFFEEFSEIELFGKKVSIPRDTEGYLETAYGRDWRIPRKWKHWYQGATCLRESGLCDLNLGSGSDKASEVHSP